ncbi:MAG: SpoIID/LytB domain-containing protein [Acidobacteria bacterium]|nr:SpoIID/LytB domain-containing protein [Acidobacteriota bacterium]
MKVLVRPAMCAMVFAAVTGAACARREPRPELVPGPDPSARLRIQVGEDRNAVRVIPLEEYVRGSVLSESAAPSGDPVVAGQMLQVQSIVARTYALANRGRHATQGFDLCSTTHCQLFQPSRLVTSRWVVAATEAVRVTRGRVLWHAGAAAVAVFHADCGGYTSTPRAAWGGTDRAYLNGFRDDGPADGVHATWTYAVESLRLREALNTDHRTRVGEWLDGITVLDRDASGRAETVALNGENERLVRGDILRQVVTGRLGARTLRSTLFAVRRAGSSLVFDGRGHGHGVGLCQVGALACLRAGASPDDVLRRYYPGITLHVVD